MQILYILIAILMLGFIVTMHEFGHYLLGRLCGIGIVEFSVGFGPKLFGFQRKGIQYSLRLIPLGGFCAFVGEDDESPAPNAMNNQSVLKRFLTVAAGPFMNFVLAFVFCAILLSCFITAELYPKVIDVSDHSPAAECGIQAGDIILNVNGSDISYDTEGVYALQSAIAADTVTITVDRDGEITALKAAPEKIVDSESGATRYLIGITLGSRCYTLPEALRGTCGYMVEFTGMMLDSIKDLIFHGAGTDELMGPVGIVSFMSDTVQSDALYGVVNLIFILSLNVGIMNLLPVPGLDGGRLIFLIVEAIRRKPVPPEKEGMVHGLGLLLLLALIVFITYQDVIRLISGG